MEKYNYLREKAWVDAWVNGGKVPIGWASWYRSSEREGTLTPDENLVDNFPVDLNKEYPGIFQLGYGKSLTIKNYTTHDGTRIPDIDNAHRYLEDGYVLCVSEVLDSEIARRLDKAACVKILDIEALKAEIDLQVGIEGIMKACEYTEGRERNNFLKSTKDAWQREFRVFWPVEQLYSDEELNSAERRAFEVILPPGMAVEVEF